MAKKRNAGADIGAVMNRLYGTDGSAILLGMPYRSYCRGSDLLVELGVWDDDGQLTNLGREVLPLVRARYDVEGRLHRGYNAKKSSRKVYIRVEGVDDGHVYHYGDLESFLSANEFTPHTEGTIRRSTSVTGSQMYIGGGASPWVIITAVPKPEPGFRMKPTKVANGSSSGKNRSKPGVALSRLAKKLRGR
jgi:hypothetical protein